MNCFTEKNINDSTLNYSPNRINYFSIISGEIK